MTTLLLHHGVNVAGAFNNTANMGNYNLATQDTTYHTDVTQTRQYGRTKYGIGLNIEQELSANVGAFMRLGWSDGRNETWAFTEIDRSATIGFAFNGTLWGQAQDVAGVAGVVNGLSDDHKNYFAAGGYGFIIGDGALNYAPEAIIEVYYRLAVSEEFFLTADYQFVVNPAYNSDRGPVHVFGIRAHLAM